MSVVSDYRHLVDPALSVEELQRLELGVKQRLEQLSRERAGATATRNRTSAEDLADACREHGRPALPIANGAFLLPDGFKLVPTGDRRLALEAPADDAARWDRRLAYVSGFARRMRELAEPAAERIATARENEWWRAWPSDLFGPLLEPDDYGGFKARPALRRLLELARKAMAALAWARLPMPQDERALAAEEDLKRVEALAYQADAHRETGLTFSGR